MTYDVNATFSRELTRIDNTHPLNMYVLNASYTGTEYLYYVNHNQDIFGWALNATGDFTNTATKYTGLPLKGNGSESNIKGEISELNISVPNTDRVMEAYIQNNNYLRGYEVYSIVSFARNLPYDANSPYYIGESAYEDYNAALKEKMYIDSVSSDEAAVTFTCKPKFVIKNIVLPGRRYSRECSFTFNGSYCNPTNRTIYLNGNAVATCPYTVEGCQARANATQFGGFPSVPKRAIYV